MTEIRYRLEQFFRALTARVSDKDITQATRTLTPRARTLFRRQAVQDQRHALNVHRMLLEAGHTNPHLLSAALLHDVGKADGSLCTIHRAIIVLLKYVAPRLLTWLNQGKPSLWNRPFIVHVQHPEIGARWAKEAGCSPLTVALIRRHEEKVAGGTTEEDHLLAILKAVDDVN